MSQMMIHISA